MSGKFTEGIVEEATLEWFEKLGYTTLHASETQRQNYTEVILTNILR